MAEGDLVNLIESQSAELASLRSLVEKLAADTHDGFQTLNWKLDRLVEIVDSLRSVTESLNARESITDKRLTRLEVDVGVIKTDIAAIKTRLEM